MDATELRAMQAPIKERYKSDPDAALITLKAKGTLDDASIACKVETGRALAIAGLHPATGGSGHGTLLGRHAAGGAGGLRRRHAEGGGDRARHSAEGRHGLGRGRSRFPRHARRRQGRAGRLPRRSGCASIVDTDAPQDKLDQLLKLTERYCVVYQTIAKGPPVDIKLQRV